MRHRIALENLREFKDDVPNPALAARGYRSLLEPDPPDVETAKDKRAELREWAAQGNEYAEGILELVSDDPFWTEGG